MMTLDEAILHCEEKAVGCNKCAEEHKQLAEWLKELKTFKELKNNMVNIKELNSKQFLNDFLEKYVFCIYCGKTYEKNKGYNDRFCSEHCKILYDVEWEASYEERKANFMREYENWQRMKPRCLL